MIMKANELMIGDWVYNKHHKKNICITPYDFFTHGHLPSGRQYFIGDPETISGRDLEPIPLTPEILEKNGFKKDEKREEMYYWNWGIGNNCVSYDKETGIVRIFHVFGHLVFVLPLSYVHELQHALRLCGIDKEIVL